MIPEGMLFTDLYQLTMAQLYFRAGIQNTPVVFEHFFRQYPDYGGHRAGYCINAGLAWLLDWMRNARFTKEDLDALRALRRKNGDPLFGEDFIGWLAVHGHFGDLSLRAVPEGRVVHPRTPITEVTGPLAVAQLLETVLLNRLNYQILVATKAARMREAAGNGLTIDFGMRRAHDLGANAATRAALIGGVDFSSNVGISHELGYPSKGTHAHSMVQAFLAMGGSELDAFRAYAECYPDDCLLLVDTVDSLHSGVPNAIRVFEELRRQGHHPVGIRLDSGDLASLAMQSARQLDEAGFTEVSIVVSGDLDEMEIMRIHERIREEAGRFGVEADRLIGRLAYGIGTRLVTSHGAPALGGVYKLVALREGDAWKSAIKLSDDPSKTLLGGRKQVWRVHDRHGMAIADVVGAHEEDFRWSRDVSLHDAETGSEWRFPPDNEPASAELLLEKAPAAQGSLDGREAIESARERRRQDLARLEDGFRRLREPERYPVLLTDSLWASQEEAKHHHERAE